MQVYSELVSALEIAKHTDGMVRIEPATVQQLLKELNGSAVSSFVRQSLAEWDEEEFRDPEGFEQHLLEGLRGLGWTETPPEPLFPLPVLTERISALQRTPWSGDNTYAQGLDDAIGTLQAMYSSKPYVPRWLRCPATKIGNACVRQLPHGEHADAVGNTWPMPKVQTT